MSINDSTRDIIGAAMEVHSSLGPGLLENVYEKCLQHELQLRGLNVTTQVPMPIRYKDIVLESAHRLDMLVNDAVVVELKSVERILPVHRYQVLSYLKFSGYPVGLVLNFNVIHLRDGICRLINSPTALRPLRPLRAVDTDA